MVLEFKTNIDYKKIVEAIEHYKKKGYKYIEVPWIISEEASSITAPKDKKRFKTFLGELTASAEQSFLELLLNKKLLPGKYVAVTPCFRDEKEEEYHYNWFFKVELIHVLSEEEIKNKKEEKILSKVIEDAEEFFKKYSKEIKRKKTDEGIDLELYDVELGSYGIRKYKKIHWVYGTGVAEPRFSEVLLKKPKGYHKMDIPKGKYGSYEKIKEELYELEDSINQNNKLMTLIELSDLIGAIEGYLKQNYNNITLEDLKIMKEATKNAFISGVRK